jgi:hypothetical protein
MTDGHAARAGQTDLPQPGLRLTSGTRTQSPASTGLARPSRRTRMIDVIGTKAIRAASDRNIPDRYYSPGL